METKRYRVQSLDVLRGLIMVIMALDHARDLFHAVVDGPTGGAALNPTNMETTYPALFFTRWITHFCAPIFVFLAGTSIYLMSQRKSKAEISRFLLTRGIWLMLLDLTIVSFAFTFNPAFNLMIMGVVWAIGVGMVIMALLIHLPYRALLLLGVVIVFGHNLFDLPAIGDSMRGSAFFDIMYFSNFAVLNLDASHALIVVYAFLPWTGVMLLGYCFGRLYRQGFDVKRRQKILLQLGGVAVLLFVLLRFSNWYGDPSPWAVQPKGAIYTFLSFLNCTKYPPSLLYLLMTIGPGMLALVWFEKLQNRFTAVMNVFGRVPMFYYVLHMYMLHGLLVIVFYLQGFGNDDIVDPNSPFLFKPDGVGFELGGVYLVWLGVVAALYPLCVWYNRYKSTHKQWWLSYL